MTNTATDKTLINALASDDFIFVDDTSAAGTTKKFTPDQMNTYVEQNIDANFARLNVAQEYTKQQNFNATSLTSTSNSIAWDLDDNQVAKHTATENTTLANPTNMIDGGTYIFIFTQDSTPRTLAFGSAYKWPGGTAPTVSTGSGAVDILTFVSDGTSMYGVSQLNYS